MTDDKKHLSAEEKLNNLAMILSEQDADEQVEITIEEQKFLERAMSLIGDWRHEYMMEEARRKKTLFERFAEPLREAIRLARESGRQIDLKTTEPSLQAAATGTFFRKLEQITQSDLDGAALDGELLKLFTELCETHGGEE
jgi:hypothetical protein